MNVSLLDPRLLLPGGSVDAFATYDQILRCAQKAVPARHTLMDDPARAEIVFLALSSQEFGPFLERVRRHPLVRPIRDRLIVYSPNDHILPVLRGLYASIDKKWIEAGRALPVHYLNRHIPRLEIRDGELGQKDIACSFVGSSHTHPVRKRILEECRSGQVYLFDSCPDARQGWWWVRQDAEELKRNYREILVRSRSVICPRGISPASMRLFEAMEAGAMPVVVADGIQLPSGPDWDSFCLFVPESELGSIPARVEAAGDSAREKGLAARAAWQRFFSEEATFNYLIDCAQRLLETPCRGSVAVRLEEYLRPENVRAKLRSIRQCFRRR